jgi:hypothetical protein
MYIYIDKGSRRNKYDNDNYNKLKTEKYIDMYIRLYTIRSIHVNISIQLCMYRQGSSE